jgi:hypothetical protein
VSELLVNGRAVLSATIESPREGAWSAEIVVDSQDVFSGLIEITDSSSVVLLKGRVLRSDSLHGFAQVSITGGAGRLGLSPPPRYYRDVSAITILRDIARETESVLAELGPAFEVRIPGWIRNGEQGAVAAIKHLIRYLKTYTTLTELVWRTRYDGALWVGTDQWLDVIAPDIQVFARRLSRGELEVSASTVAELLALEPGTVFEGVDISSIRIEVRESSVSAVVRTHNQARKKGEGLIESLEKIAREATVERPLYAMHPARIVAQHSSSDIDVELLDSSMPAITRVKLIAPFPSGKVFFSAADVSARAVTVLVGFEGGDASRPYAVPWSTQQGTLDRVEINASTAIHLAGSAKAVARVDDSVAGGTLTGLAPPGAMGGAVQFIYTPHGSTPLPPSPSVTISGKITTGSPKVKTG